MTFKPCLSGLLMSFVEGRVLHAEKLRRKWCGGAHKQIPGVIRLFNLAVFYEYNLRAQMHGFGEIMGHMDNADFLLAVNIF